VLAQVARTRKESTTLFSKLAVAMEIQRQRSYPYFARNDSRKEPVIPSVETLVFLEWEFAMIRRDSNPTSSHYRESGQCLIRADVTEERIFSVEN